MCVLIECVWNICITSHEWCPCSLRWRRNGRDGVSNHQPCDCLLKRLFRRRSRKTLKLRVTGLCEGNSPVTGEFPAQRARNAENDSIDDVIMFKVNPCYQNGPRGAMIQGILFTYHVARSVPNPLLSPHWETHWRHDRCIAQYHPSSVQWYVISLTNS